MPGRINWEAWKVQQALLAAAKFFARFRKKRKHRRTKRPKPLWRFNP